VEARSPAYNPKVITRVKARRNIAMGHHEVRPIAGEAIAGEAIAGEAIAGEAIAGEAIAGEAIAGEANRG
jgi:hypothetical protein